MILSLVSGVSLVGRGMVGDFSLFLVVVCRVWCCFWCGVCVFCGGFGVGFLLSGVLVFWCFGGLFWCLGT